MPCARRLRLSQCPNLLLTDMDLDMEFWCTGIGLFIPLSLGLHCLRGMRGVSLAINHDHQLVWYLLLHAHIQGADSDS